ncbi:MAG: DUF488 domain-containing protein [Chloroflexota bacterium]
MIKLKRAYQPPAAEDGRRFLVDRLWPRGVKKDALALDAWLKDAAPSTELRKWFNHDPDKWDEFQQRYSAELDANAAAWEPLLQAAREGTITLIYSARDEEHNQAVALKTYLERKL